MKAKISTPAHLIDFLWWVLLEMIPVKSILSRLCKLSVSIPLTCACTHIKLFNLSHPSASVHRPYTTPISMPPLISKGNFLLSHHEVLSINILSNEIRISLSIIFKPSFCIFNHVISLSLRTLMQGIMCVVIRIMSHVSSKFNFVLSTQPICALKTLSFGPIPIKNGHLVAKEWAIF